MNKNLIGVILLVLPSLCHALSMDFCGYVKLADGEVLFAFKDSASKFSSPWMRVGQHWGGWTLLEFDEKTESVELISSQTRISLSLASFRTAPVGIPSFEGGTFTLADGTVVYSHEAVLHIGKAKVSSPTGVMVANKSTDQVSGDLLIETPEGTFTTTEASIRLVDGQTNLVAKTMTLQNQNSQTSLTRR